MSIREPSANKKERELLTKKLTEENIDLAMFVRRLVSAVERLSEIESIERILTGSAMDYLRRNGMVTVPAPPGPVKPKVEVTELTVAQAAKIKRAATVSAFARIVRETQEAGDVSRARAAG